MRQPKLDAPYGAEKTKVSQVSPKVMSIKSTILLHHMFSINWIQTGVLKLRARYYHLLDKNLFKKVLAL